MIGRSEYCDEIKKKKITNGTRKIVFTAQKGRPFRRQYKPTTAIANIEASPGMHLFTILPVIESEKSIKE